jgi:putative redox protein
MATKQFKISAKLVDNFKIEGQIRDHHLIVDQPKLAGGNNEGPSPLEYNCFSLAACVLSIGQIIAKQKRITLRNFEATVISELDPDVYMGKNKELRSGFTGFKVLTKIDADMSIEEKKAFLEEIDLRCPVSENLQHSTSVTLELDQ